tara:strand:- start:564 stop:737 length:174 start_codon:yes stop_codon:yes gene_type:complete
MAKKKGSKKRDDRSKKKTSIGHGKFTKTYSKGGGPKGSTTSKRYKKKYRGQGKKRKR